MSGSLENRSSLRKLEFPNCTIEALKRLHATCVTVSPKLPKSSISELASPSTLLVLSPKETELVLDIVDEFVFFTKSKSKKLATSMQELQLLQIIIDFYQETLSDVSDSLVLDEVTGPMLLLTNYLFMDSNPKEDKRSHSLARFTALALGLKNRPALHCIGLWLQQHQNSNALALRLASNVQSDFVSLSTDAKGGMNNFPNISAVFAASFMTAFTELQQTSDNWPQLQIVEILTQWMESRIELMSISGSGLFLGLARWTILHPLVVAKAKDPHEDAIYAQMHLFLLESLADSKSPKLSVPSKALILLIGKVEAMLKNHDLQCDLGSRKELALDRLGQILHCLSSTNCIQGKVTEICSSVRKLGAQNRLMDMYTARYGK